MHDSDKHRSADDTRSKTTMIRPDDISSDGAEEQFDSGHASLDLHSTTMPLHSMGGLEIIEESAVDANLCSMDLDKDFSAMNIDNDISVVTKDKDSGIFLSLLSRSCEQSEHGSTSPIDVCMAEDSKTIMEVECNPPRNETASLEQINKGLVETNKDGDNQLNLNIIHERTEETLRLISLAPDFEWLCMQNTMWQTPLHLAVATGQADIVRRLICAGAIVTMQDNWGNTPLHCACALGHEQIVRHFLVPVQYEETRQNRYKIPFQRLPQSSEIRNYEGDTCLHIAARTGNLNIVRMLLESGADPNVGDGKAGRTVLHHAAEWGNEELVRLLISKRRVDLNALDYARRTPARLAYGRLKINIVRLLERHGASVVSLSDSSDNDLHETDLEFRHDASG